MWASQLTFELDFYVAGGNIIILILKCVLFKTVSMIELLSVALLAAQRFRFALRVSESSDFVAEI